MFFVFDGMDGTGKSTQLDLFVQWLQEQDHDVVVCRDPGSTELGIQLRELLLQERGLPIHMRSELLMFISARAQVTEEVIRPALEAGKTVVCDRYVLSTVVYQGYGGDIDPNQVWRLNYFATNGVAADLTFVFDLEPEIALSRLGDNLDRLESRGTEYFERLRFGFTEECKRFPIGYDLIDASGSIEEVQQRVRAAANVCLSKEDKASNANRES